MTVRMNPESHGGKPRVGPTARAGAGPARGPRARGVRRPHARSPLGPGTDGAGLRIRGLRSHRARQDNQSGILTRLQQKAATVRVLTNPASAPNMKPLKALGAEVNTLPSRFTGRMVIVQGRAVILPFKGGGFAVMRGTVEIG